MRGLSLLLSVCGVVAAWLIWRLLLPLVPAETGAGSMGVRIGMALAALLPSGFVLAGMIAAQMLARFLAGAIDPTAGQDTRFLLVNQRVITNTVEQLAIFVPALLALAAAIPGGRMAEPCAAALVFALARLAFWGGYAVAPIARAPGMAATFAVNATCLLAAAFAWLT